MSKQRFAIAYTLKTGGAAKGFLEFLKIRENVEYITIISADWKFSRKYYIKSRINALMTRILQRFLFEKSVKCSLNFFPIIDLANIYNAKVYIGWVGNGMINFKNNATSEYIVRFSDEWWVNDIQHYRLNDKVYFPSILKKKINFLNNKNVTIIFPSRWLEKSFISALGECKLNCKTFIVRNIASDAFFIKAKHNIRCLYFVASKLSDPNKGFHALCDNLDVLKPYFDDIFIIGSSRGVSEVKGLNFLGHVDRTDLAHRFKSGGVYLHLAMRDNSPNSLIEACSAGLIPIVMGGSGAQEYVEDIVFKVPLILKPTGDLRTQICDIMDELSSCSADELDDLVFNIQRNIQRLCGIHDNSNY